MFCALGLLRGPLFKIAHRLISPTIQWPQERGQAPVIDVTGHDPIDIEAILVFIYAGGSCPPSPFPIVASIVPMQWPRLTLPPCDIAIDPKIFPDDAYPSACVRLYQLGHIFRVTNLSDFATNELGLYLSIVLKSICNQRLWVPAHKQECLGRTEIQDRLRRNNFMADYLTAVERADRVRRAGDTEMELLRPYQMLVDFFLAGQELLLYEPEFKLWLENDMVPSFAKTVLLTRRRGGSYSEWMKNLVCAPAAAADMPSRQGLCYDCRGGLKNIKETGGAGFVNPRSWKGSYTQVICQRCCKREKNLGDDGLLTWDVFSPRKD